MLTAKNVNAFACEWHCSRKSHRMDVVAMNHEGLSFCGC